MTQAEDVQVPAQVRGRAPQELVEAYAAAWNAHDGAAVAALVTGSYSDPTLAAPVRGEELAAVVDGLCAAFPDLRFEHVSSTVQGDRAVFEWRMRGTNDGTPLPGAPAPTGGTVDLRGIDVITTADGRVVDVVGYFDQKAFVEQLGLQTFTMPVDSWPVSYGTSVRVDVGNVTVPGAVSMTWIEVDDAEQGELLARTTEMLTGWAGDAAFLGFQSASVGRRNLTLTAWTSPAAAEAAIARSAAHTAAVQRVTRDGFGARGFTSLWQPYRLNDQFVQCSCGASVPLLGQPTATCACGLEHAAQPYV